jgi:hypothetical protein
MTTIKYDPYAELEIRSQHLASFMYILGIDEKDFSKVTIDDLISLIRKNYAYDHDISLDVASKEYIKKQNIALSRGVRRAWFDVQFANYEVKNVQ